MMMIKRDPPVAGKFDDLIVDCHELRVVVAPAVPLDQVLSVCEAGSGDSVGENVISTGHITGV